MYDYDVLALNTWTGAFPRATTLLPCVYAGR
jgi:hypothetical protein